MPKKIKTARGWGIMAGVVMRGLFFSKKLDAERVARAYGDKAIEVELIPRRIERENQGKVKPLAEVENGALWVDGKPLIEMGEPMTRTMLMTLAALINKAAEGAGDAGE